MQPQRVDVFKLVVELVAGKGFTAGGGLTNSVVVMSFGQVQQKVKTKFKKPTPAPVWSDHFEFPLMNTSTNNNAMSLNIVFQEKKSVIGQIKLDSSALSKLHQVFKDVWADVEQPETAPKSKLPQVKLRLKIALGLPQKKPTKIPVQNVVLPKAIQRTKGAKEKFGTTPILEYIKDGDPVGLEEHLANYPNSQDLNQPHPQNGNTPLHVCCLELKLEKREAILQILLTAEHIQVDIPNANKNTPLHYFCQHWSSPDLTCFNLFIKHGANVNAVNSNGETPLFKAIFNRPIRTLLFEALLEHNADVNVTSNLGEGVLHYAVHLGREDLVDMILQARPNLNIKGQDGYTPYQLASVVYNTEEHKKIAKHLKLVTELFDWLEANKLSNYKGLFIKNEITLNLIPDITDALLKQMHIDSEAERALILKAATEYSNSMHDTEDLKRPSTNNDDRQKKKEDLIKTALESPLGEARSQVGAGSKSNSALVKELSELRPFTNTDEWIIDDSDLEYVKHLGTGTSGDVYKGLFEKREVAIKVLKEMNSSQEADEFKKEFEILSAVRSPYVVWFYGATVQKRLCMVMEYCARDTLHHVLKQEGQTVEWDFAINVFKEVVMGLMALHNRQPQILHRDLKSLNLLVTQDWHIKICDFGLSRFNTPENLATLSQIRGTFAFCDPSLYTGAIYTDSSDIYSLGITIWEVVNRIYKKCYERPYSEYKAITFDFQIIIKASGDNLRPTIPANCPPLVAKLITACLHGKQELRPSLDELSGSIDLIRQAYDASPSLFAT